MPKKAQKPAKSTAHTKHANAAVPGIYACTVCKVAKVIAHGSKEPAIHCGKAMQLTCALSTDAGHQDELKCEMKFD